MTGVRPARPAELPALKALWQAVFGDEAAFVESFYAHLLPASRVLAAEREGRPVGAAYVVDCFTLVGADGGGRPCPYVYAVAVEAAQRGLGLGKNLSLAAASLCREAGRLSCLVPASAGLFDFYARFAGYSPAFAVCEGEAPAAGGCAPAPLSPAAYLAEREKRLAGRGHLRPSPEAMDFWEASLRMEGGGFFRLTLPGGETALAAVELTEQGPFAKELLCTPGREAAFAAALAAHDSRESCRWRCPPGGAGAERPFGMLSEAVSAPLYFGPAFD